VEWQDVTAARLLVKPSALREVSVEVPRTGWDDVGGLAGVKQRLVEAVSWPVTHAEALARLGATPPRGVLLYGPPGAGKTALARAVAASAGLSFLAVKGGELHGRYVGQAERALAALFARARAAAPAIVFFDELDALVGARSSGAAADGGGSRERVLAQMLTEMDGLQVRC
jgi:AAA family ATPase